MLLSTTALVTFKSPFVGLLGTLGLMTGMRSVNQRTVDLVKNAEGYETQLPNGNCMAYLDTAANRRSWSPGYAGLWTIGWGATGPGITRGTIWTRQQAEDDLRARLNDVAQEILAYVHVPLNDNQLGALTSLGYNVGLGGIHGMLNLVNAGNYQGAADAFVLYDHSDGVELAGLKTRRLAEKELFQWETPDEVAQLSTPINVARKAQVATFLGSIGTFFSWQNVHQVRDIATDNMGWVLLGIAGVAFVTFKWYESSLQTSFDNGHYTPPGTIPPPDPEHIPDPATVEIVKAAPIVPDSLPQPHAIVSA